MTNPKVYREQPVFPSQESDQSMINSQESANLSMLDSGFVSVLQIHVRVEHEIFTERQKVAMEEHRKYYTSMIRYINGKEKGQDADLPKKPKSSIAFLEVEKK